MLPVNQIEFSSDTAHRKQWFRGCSFSHPAKMHLSLQFYLIEHYTKPGDTILDCMSGSGTLLVGCALGRNVICVELEKKFIDMQKANWEKIKALGPILGYTMGEAAILQGDARNLEGLLADSCIFSPPYAETTAIQDFEFMAKQAEDFPERLKQGLIKGHARGTKAEKRWLDKTAAGQIESPNNIGNLPYGEIPVVISSPPYNAEPTISESYKRIRTEIGRDTTKPSQKYEKYSAKADVICTSPPYAEAQEGGGIAKKGYINNKSHSKNPDTIGNRSYMPEQIGKSDGQIGNLKSENYLQAMLTVYQQCHRVLRDGGLMILVVKNFIRNKKIVRLDTDTIKLCESAGFVLKERLERKLTQQSFWRTIYYKKYPDAPKIEFEDILVFRKGCLNDPAKT